MFTAWDMEEAFAVDFAIEGITATEGDDYYLQGANPGVYGSTISFAAHELECTFYIVIVDDWIFEEDEELRIVLSNPVNIDLGPESTVTTTIIDNDPFIVILPEPLPHLDPLEHLAHESIIGFEPPSAEEQRYAIFVIEMIGRGEGPGFADVTWTTLVGQGDTATGDEDFEITEGTVTVYYGQPTTIQVPLLYDESAEEPETFHVALTEATSDIVILMDSATATIIDPSSLPQEEPPPDCECGIEQSRYLTDISSDTGTELDGVTEFWEGDSVTFTASLNSQTPAPSETFAWEWREARLITRVGNTIYGQWQALPGGTNSAAASYTFNNPFAGQVRVTLTSSGRVSSKVINVRAKAAYPIVQPLFCKSGLG